MDLENSKPEDVVFSHAFLRIETPKKKALVLGLKTEVIVL